MSKTNGFAQYGVRFTLLACGALLTCGGSPQLPTGTPTPVTFFQAQTTDIRFRVAEHFIASIEMQISGEPFAQLIGRDLAGYDRFNTTTDLWIDPATGQALVDPLSYSLGVESYEYSKQPMNNVSFESGAGLSLQYGPILNPSQVTGDDAVQLLVDRLQHLAEQSSTAGLNNFVTSPPPEDNPLNVYGWPGYWPEFAEFQSFDPSIAPSGGATNGCTFNGGYAAAAAGAQTVGDYECGYVSLNLPLRDTQVTKLLDPAALGFASWKQMLWVINYWQSLHDLADNPISEVDEADLPLVGTVANQVVGRYPDPNDPTGETLIDGVPGVYMGDVPIEGWQGLTMIDEIQNKAALLLGQLLTSDGTQLGGLSTKDAIDYDYSSPLRWWPSEIAVTENNPSPAALGTAWRYFPQPTQLTVQSPKSTLRGLVGLAGGFAELYALTDFNNPDVGGTVSSRVTFDGDPFPADNQLADGEDTPHDRALGILKLAIVDLDRLHFDPTHAVLVDEASVQGGQISRGSTVTTLDAAYAIVALRAALRSISSSLVLYSNDTPDVIGAPTALDGAKLSGASTTLAARILQLIRAQADFLVDQLADQNGAVANGYDLAAGKADASPTLLQSEASAIRALLEAYLATSDERYRQAAERIWGDLDARFWMPDVRAFRTTAGVDDTLTWTPLQFGTIQGAMRQYWKLVGSQPGNERLAAELLERIQRINKLVANGWDDANGDNKVQYPDECTGAGLQMAERALTGELSREGDKGDRDKDCVKEIAAARLPSALAAEIVLTRRK